ncbi:MAG: hypothetical protein J3R72DRAFT_180847 [Linnemannia gamsii]|nr:MAG: hypothetical protein J3R72DRAFT_180847 [Linnemannia gamsii]
MLRNTMDNNLLTLNCLVDGLPTSRAFSIKISFTDTVGDLKKLIKAEQTPAFDDITVDQLNLWYVSIPDDDDDDEIPIVLGNVNNKDKKKLRATRGLLEVFPDKPPKNTIHVIIQRPQVHAPLPFRALTPLPGYLSGESRPATPIQLKSVPKDQIEKELTVVLEGVSHHHITEPVDPKDVESSQRERLGPFYKRTLPYHETATDTSLVMLGLELDKQASMSDGETLHSIVEGDIGRYTDHRVVAMVALSGSGKTATVVDLASKHFVIYCVCCSRVQPFLQDSRIRDLSRLQRMLSEYTGAFSTKSRGRYADHRTSTRMSKHSLENVSSSNSLRGCFSCSYFSTTTLI